MLNNSRHQSNESTRGEGICPSIRTLHKNGGQALQKHSGQALNREFPSPVCGAHPYLRKTTSSLRGNQLLKRQAEIIYYR
jgi:hypothetical protein